MAKDVKTANLNRAQKAKALHDKKTKERLSDAKAVKAVYLAEREGPLLEDLLKKANGFIKYHVKIAQDGVGARKTGHLLSNGQPEVENYFLSNSEIAGEMKKAAGLQELVDYIERQTKLPDATDVAVKPKKAETAKS
jgi:hypothetical protein